MAYKYKLDTIPKLALAEDAAASLAARAEHVTNKCEAMAMVLASELIQSASEGNYMPSRISNLDEDNQGIVVALANEAIMAEFELTGPVILPRVTIR